ncbi:helix-turn-helix domain-containing protein [Bradyrhizobium sp. CSA207]|nr:helix-turn-helix domain-containing protein [Bradyrhizobium sp. CSA207]
MANCGLHQAKDSGSGRLAISESFLQTQSLLRATLARRVKERRQLSKLSQRDLAERAGIRQALVSQIELGEANVTLDSLLRIAIALDVDLAGLFAAKGDDPQVGSRHS